MSSPVLSRRAARYSMLALALVACGAETKPAGPDAKTPEKATPPPGDVAKLPVKADPQIKVREGADPGEDRYVMKIDVVEAAVGREGSFNVTVTPKAPWHMNLDFPTSLAIGAPDGVTLAKQEMKKADADKLDETSAEYSVKFTPAAAGDKSFTGKFKFAVCQDEACSPVTEEVAFKVAVK
jgi:hypothetical protein